MAAPSEADIVAVAAQFSIPPAVLNGVVKAQGMSASFNLPGASLGAYGLSATQVARDPLLGLAVAARTLAQSFERFGSWPEALSQYLTGDPSAYQSATAATGGQVEAILGAAAIDPGFGLSGFTPADSYGFQAGAAAFGQHLESLMGSGGVVTRSSLQQYQGAVAQTTGIPSSGRGVWNTKITSALQSAARNNAQGNYEGGQCTYYAARSLGYIPGGLGNAVDWAHNASERGFRVDAQPAVGTAVVYGAGGGYSQYGHVAVVTAVNADGTFTVSEMNVNGQWVADSRVSSMQSVLGFIHPPEGTDMVSAAPGLAQHVQSTAGPDDGSVHAPTPPPTQTQTPTATSTIGAANTRPADPNAQHPDPAQVAEFANQLRAAGISAQDFVRFFPGFAAQSRKLLDSRGVSVSDFGQAVTALLLQGAPLSEAGLVAHLRDQPHPTYPNVTVGAFHDAFDQAMLHSVLHTQSVPSNAEAARFAAGGAGWKEMSDYYQRQAGLFDFGRDTAKPADNVVALPNQQQQPKQGVGAEELAARHERHGA